MKYPLVSLLFSSEWVYIINWPLDSPHSWKVLPPGKDFFYFHLCYSPCTLTHTSKNRLLFIVLFKSLLFLDTGGSIKVSPGVLQVVQGSADVFFKEPDSKC